MDKSYPFWKTFIHFKIIILLYINYITFRFGQLLKHIPYHIVQISPNQQSKQK